jgi:hypothetical protein
MKNKAKCNVHIIVLTHKYKWMYMIIILLKSDIFLVYVNNKLVKEVNLIYWMILHIFFQYFRVTYISNKHKHINHMKYEMELISCTILTSKLLFAFSVRYMGLYSTKTERGIFCHFYAFIYWLWYSSHFCFKIYSRYWEVYIFKW